MQRLGAWFESVRAPPPPHTGRFPKFRPCPPLLIKIFYAALISEKGRLQKTVLSEKCWPFLDLYRYCAMGGGPWAMPPVLHIHIYCTLYCIRCTAHCYYFLKKFGKFAESAENWGKLPLQLNKNLHNPSHLSQLKLKTAGFALCTVHTLQFVFTVFCTIRLLKFKN